MKPREDPLRSCLPCAGDLTNAGIVAADIRLRVSAGTRHIIVSHMPGVREDGTGQKGRDAALSLPQPECLRFCFSVHLKPLLRTVGSRDGPEGPGAGHPVDPGNGLTSGIIRPPIAIRQADLWSRAVPPPTGYIRT